jgi:hypothetical protein
VNKNQVRNYVFHVKEIKNTGSIKVNRITEENISDKKS